MSIAIVAGDRVADDVGVIEGRLERLLRHRVHGAPRDELGDVQRVGKSGVLDAGRRP